MGPLYDGLAGIFTRLVRSNIPQPAGTPSDDEIWQAKSHSSLCLLYLETVQRWAREGKFSSDRINNDIAALTDKAFQTLRDEHGGLLPEGLFDRWLRRRQTDFDHHIYSPEERQALRKIMERWSDSDEFMALSPPPRVPIKDLSASQYVDYLRRWLQEHRNVGETRK